MSSEHLYRPSNYDSLRRSREPHAGMASTEEKVVTSLGYSANTQPKSPGTGSASWSKRHTLGSVNRAVQRFMHGRSADPDVSLSEGEERELAKPMRPATTTSPGPSGEIHVQRCANCGNVFCADGEICGGKNSRKRKYDAGEHGGKSSEQKRLKKVHNITVSGSTHESEHAVGFEPINRTSGLERGTPGRARNLENKAPAYQEVKQLHRDHIGTGTSNQIDASGFNSTTYRDSQRSLIESGDVSSAVQLNQLGYAFDPGFKLSAGTMEGQAATDSYNVMVGGMDSLTYAQGANDVTVPVDPGQQAEMYLARKAAQTGQWPTDDQINEAKKLFGL